MVEVFKTNVTDVAFGSTLKGILERSYPGSRVNFDHEDSDNILRVEYATVNPAEIVSLLRKYGVNAEGLE